MDLSVNIVNWNTCRELRRCLASLRAAASRSSLSLEVVVVDNASVDGSAAMVAEEFPEIRLLANDENRNYAAGSNQALAVSVGEYVLLLNPDTVVPEGTLEALVGYLRAHPRAAGVAPALVLPSGSIQQSVRGFPAPLAILGELLGLARYFPGGPLGGYRARTLPLDRPSVVEQPMASALLLRRAVLVQLGGFDEGFPLFFNDVDLCYRIRRAGWEIHYDPRIRVQHVGGAATRQVRARAIQHSHAGLLRFYRLYYRPCLPWPAYLAIVITIRVTGWLRACVAALLEVVSPRRVAGPAPARDQ